MAKRIHYQGQKTGINLKPNLWDSIAFIIILSLLWISAFAASRIHVPYQIGTPIDISLAPSALPGYAANTVLRMFLALICSLLFTFTIAPLAAKSRQAEKLLIPLIDILQCVPILGVLSMTIATFIQLFPNSLLGPECAAIFAIFTSQVWNMTLSFYQSIRSTPKTFYETALMFHLTPWQQFWRIEVPYAIPGLLWNTMVSMSAGWFFVVASEAISVSNQKILLPGIGSYISVAIAEANYTAICYAIIAMLVVILLYDQLLFRPLFTWGRRFNGGQFDDNPLPNAWFYQLLTRTHLLKYINIFFNELAEFLLKSPRLRLPPLRLPPLKSNTIRFAVWFWNSLLILSVVITCAFLWDFISQSIEIAEIQHVFYLGAITAFKVTLLIILASLVWVPVGVFIGLHPKAAHIIQPITQFLAAFPINLIYPLVVTAIIYFQLNVEIWSTPLMILGTQWYILFNVIAGANAIPKELQLVAKNFGLSKWLWWKRLALPAIFPYYVTGSMTAAAGCWNASIVADILEWGDHKLVATGLGSYISQYTTIGDFPRIALGIAVMCLYVLVMNQVIWQKLYRFATTRFVLE